MDVLQGDDRAWFARPSSRSVLIALGASALVVIAAALGASSTVSDSAANGALRALMVGAPLGAAFAADRTGQPRGFVLLLAAIGALSFVTTLAETTDPAAYTLGRTAGWFVELLLVALLLAAPTGALTDPIDRRLATAMGAVVAVFYVPLLLLTPDLPVPNPFTSCVASCPDNPLAIVATGAPLPSGYSAAGGLLVFAVMAAVSMRLYHCMMSAPPLYRRVLVPIATLGMARAGLVGGAIVAREFRSATEVVQTSATAIAWLTPLISLAVLFGFLSVRRRSTEALGRLASEVRHTPDLPAVERALAQALGEPSVALTLSHPAGGAQAGAGWTDCCGNAVPDPATRPATTVDLVRDRQGAVVAAISCHTSTPRRPALAQASAVAAAAIENLRQEAAGHQAERDVRESRARIAAAADRERRRIERDLHDGAQQRLVALRIELGLVGALVHRAPGECAARLDQLTGAVDEALEEIRSLAHGVCPPLLDDRGLATALGAAASHCTVPVRVEARGLGRYSPELERAVYFCVLEALQNVAKHAHATHATVHLERCLNETGDALRFSVRDDGCGAPPRTVNAGRGVANMRDRMAALSGELVISTPTSGGTVVTGIVPITAVDSEGSQPV